MASKTDSGIPPHEVQCFLDTNVFLHFRMFDEVDWPEVVGASNVCLVVAPAVLAELDRFKDDHTVTWRRDRARKVLSKLDQFLPAGSSLEPSHVRQRVRIRGIAREPAVDWRNLGLDPTIPDDRLIASLLETEQQHPRPEVCLISADRGPRWKAGNHSIKTIDPTGKVSPEAPASEEQKTIAAQRQQIAELEQRLAERDTRRAVRELALPRRDAFLSDQRERLLRHKLPAKLIGYPLAALHVLPLSAFADDREVDFTRIPAASTDIYPSRWVNSVRREYDAEGIAYCEYAPDSEAAYGYLKIYRNGCIELVNAEIMRAEPGMLPVTEIEDEFIAMLKRILSLQRTLAVDPPIWITMTLVGVQDLSIAVKQFLSGYRRGRPFGGEILELPLQELDRLDGDPATILKPIYDRLWNAAGYAGTPNYDSQGKRRQQS